MYRLGELLKFLLNILVYLLGGSDRTNRPLHGDRGLHLPVFRGRQSDGGGRGGLPGEHCSHTEVIFIFHHFDIYSRWRWPWWPSFQVSSHTEVTFIFRSLDIDFQMDVAVFWLPG
jgi:hypothetical protein